MKLYIKYMVSARCKMLVRTELKKIGLHDAHVELGVVEFKETLSETTREQLKTILLRSGLELMDDKKAILIEKIKTVVLKMVHYSDDMPRVKFSVYLADKLGYDYTYLANLFSETEGTTIEQYVLHHKIERVKELILYDELNFTQIAWKLHYSSVAALSNQFKKMTGLTPSYYKALRNKKRSTLENV